MKPKELTKSEAERLAEKAIPDKNGNVMPSLLILHSTEAQASQEKSDVEKLVPDPLNGEVFNKLLQRVEDLK